MASTLPTDGKIRHSEAFHDAARILFEQSGLKPFPKNADENCITGWQDEKILFVIGPVVHAIGLATELVLKAILSHSGECEKDLTARKHNLVEMFEAVSPTLRQTEFHKCLLNKLQGYAAPSHWMASMKEAEKPASNQIWCEFETHLIGLNDLYDRPFRARYPKAEQINLPDLWICLLGIETLMECFNTVVVDDQKQPK
jgi:hypothetical protein